MFSNSARRAAQEKVAAYHEAQLAELVRRVAADIDRYRSGEVDAFDVDQVIFQYSPGREGVVEVLQPRRRRARRIPGRRAAVDRPVAVR